MMSCLIDQGAQMLRMMDLVNLSQKEYSYTLKLKDYLKDMQDPNAE